MNKNDYVEITGLIPKELQRKKHKNGKKMTRPFYGQIKKISGTRVTVKPRYQRFTVVVHKDDLTVVPYEKYNVPRKATKKPKAKKVVAKKPAPVKKETPKKVQKSGDVRVEGDGPVKVVPNPDATPTFKEEVAEKIEKKEAAVDTDKAGPDVPIRNSESGADTLIDAKPKTPEECHYKHGVDYDSTSEPNDVIQSEEPVPVEEPVHDWLKSEVDIDAELEQESIVDDEQSGGVLIYVVIGIITVGAAIGIWYLIS